MNNKKTFVVFYSQTNDLRVGRLEEESRKLGLLFKSFNLHKDLLMTQNGFFDIKTKSPLDLTNSTCWVLSNSIMSHYLENVYSKKINSIWPNSEAINFSDKMLSINFLHSLEIKTPETILITHDEQLLSCGIEFVSGFPCIIKKTFGSGGEEVAVVNSKEEIKQIIKNTYKKKSAKELSPFLRASFILQKYIADSKGTDYRVLCINGKIIGGIKRTSQNGDFRANVSLGGRAEPFEIDSALKSICEKILSKGNIFYAGIDFIKNNNEWLVIEINTSAQFQGFEEATGINVAKKIVKSFLEKA